ncbi:hypothetical protein OPW36_18455 [Vibrio europaeus]|uniref:Uncharacterized protein n=1 Tax=Vibrio europaeus TaxID=300876 RepID=A0AAE7B294_9VIBR|nr:hypothetical protein [Vibrio europaeus]MDC5805215.1 hypothetical protein [Vibrio europaeus]MDC5811480.1 hypothetical protein [Vibrio europaeus]MDC5826710.1 hypothetical protein [Vibrio europaeus]MDC5832076.1 hypothetical protein [Vibrio europaeus]MDC5835031.1 hypothetical protein [Vibrio europaeus]
MVKYIRENRSIFVSVFLLVFVGIVSFGSFFFKFNGGLSSDQQDWGAFGSFLSGTLGVLIAFLAVAWLIKSVQIQKKELSHLKNELKATGMEQQKQTEISALSALISSSESAISVYESKLVAMNNGDKHLHPMEDNILLHNLIHEEERKINFYKNKLESFLSEVYQKRDISIKEKLDEFEEF